MAGTLNRRGIVERMRARVDCDRHAGHSKAISLGYDAAAQVTAILPRTALNLEQASVRHCRLVRVLHRAQPNIPS